LQIKRTLLVGAAVATIGLGGIGTLGLASAATDNSTDGGSTIVEKIATRFNLNEDEVQAVFDEHHKSHEAEMKAAHRERIAQAVTDGKLTQEQADHISKTLEEIHALRGDASPKELSDTSRQQIREKMDALHDWADEQDIDMHDIGPIRIKGHHGPGGPEGHGGFRMHSDRSADTSES
jgi:hypothetical protein